MKKRAAGLCCFAVVFGFLFSGTAAAEKPLPYIDAGNGLIRDIKTGIYMIDGVIEMYEEEGKSYEYAINCAISSGTIDELYRHKYIDPTAYGGMFIMEDGALGIYVMEGREDEVRAAIERHKVSDYLSYRLLPGTYSYREMEDTRELLRPRYEELHITMLSINESANRIYVGIIEDFYSDELVDEICGYVNSDCIEFFPSPRIVINDC